MVNANNVAGHRARFEHFKKTLPPDELGPRYVGGGDVHYIGYMEREVIARHASFEGASVVDVGCGIGRLTRYLKPEPIRSYLGIDVVTEILEEAARSVDHDPRFSFAMATQCRIPAPDKSTDIVCGFSLITHLLDEQVYEYFTEAKRVLKPGGLLALSFLDFSWPVHQGWFLAFVKKHSTHHDVLKFLERDTIRFFAKSAGLQIVEFGDPDMLITAKGSSTTLNGVTQKTSFPFGQALVWMRA